MKRKTTRNPRKKPVRAYMRLLDDPADIREYSLWLFFGDKQENVTRYHQSGPQPLAVWKVYVKRQWNATLRKRTAREYDVIMHDK